jgi:integrator complex subunit 1
VQCLCEFLLSSGTLLQPEKQHKHQQLLQHLQMVLTDVKQDPQAPCEVLEYFLRRLSSSQAASRAQAIKVSAHSNYEALVATLTNRII